jgi:hypothetical protein
MHEYDEHMNCMRAPLQSIQGEGEEERGGERRGDRDACIYLKMRKGREDVCEREREL